MHPDLAVHLCLYFFPAVPWDVAEDYDLIVPGGPINGDDVLLYLPGHLMFFKHAKSVVDEFMNFPNLKTMHAFLNLPWIGHDAGTLTRSSFYYLFDQLFMTNRRIRVFPFCIHKSSPYFPPLRRHGHNPLPHFITRHGYLQHWEPLSVGSMDKEAVAHNRRIAHGHHYCCSRLCPRLETPADVF